MDVEVAPQPDADKTILTRPETVKKETPKAETVKEEEPETAEKPAETSSADDLDLDALFQETAASLSDEIAHDSVLEKALEEEQTEESLTEKTVEESQTAELVKKPEEPLEKQPETGEQDDDAESENEACPIRRREDLQRTNKTAEPVIVQREE